MHHSKNVAVTAHQTPQHCDNNDTSQEPIPAMLDRNAMAQLKGLREELEAQNEHVEATVKGTQHRYGFAVTADGARSVYPAR